MEQAGQKHPETAQVQLGFQAGQELAARRSQVAGTEQKQHGRIGERDDRGRRHLPEHHQGKAQGKAGQEQKEEEGKLAPQRGLGRKIDIRI